MWLRDMEESGIEVKHQGKLVGNILCAICKRQMASVSIVENGNIKFICSDCAIEEVNPSSRYD